MTELLIRNFYMLGLKKRLVFLVCVFISCTTYGENIVSVEYVDENIHGIQNNILAKVIAADEYIAASYLNAHVLTVLKPGTKIKKGQIIAELDTQFLILEKKKHVAKIEKLTALVKYLTKDLARLEKLSLKDGIQITKVDDARQALTEAKLDSEIELYQLTEVEKRLALSKVAAPITGIVAERFVSSGEYVARGAKIARLISSDDIELVANFPTEDIDILNLVTTVNVKSGIYSGEASIKRVLKEVIDGTQSIQVFFKPSPILSNQLVIGMNADLLIDFPALETVLVPNDALIPQGNTSYVYIINDQDIVKKVTVEILAGHFNQYVVKGDIHKGDKVVVRGGLSISEGDKVVVKKGIL